MSSFFQDLWLSVFEPGTNPSLIIATHVSFFLLQCTFFALLVATYSYHFLFLSLICAGLWAGTTWFVSELEALKKQQQEEGGDRKAAEKKNE